MQHFVVVLGILYERIFFLENNISQKNHSVIRRWIFGYTHLFKRFFLNKQMIFDSGAHRPVLA